MRGDRMAQRSSFGSTIRKRLSDITNYQPQPKSPPVFDQILAHNASSLSTKDYIDQLLKGSFGDQIGQENAGLMKLVTDKNKVIELNGLELQKLRVNLQKLQLQNWNLAQSNSRMLAELNLGRQKLKGLQHQLTCKDALLKTKNLELEAQCKMNDQNNGSQDGDDADTKQCISANRRRRPIRSQSIGPSASVQPASEKETVENKRRCLRRQSARFRSQEHEPDNLFEIEDLKMHEDGPTSMVNGQKDGKCSYLPEPQELQRMSLRPSRKAAEKVLSYKETPLNIKMRRQE